MTPPATRFTEEILISPTTAISRYGEAVAAVMDRAAKSTSRDVQMLAETEMKWHIGFLRGPDPATSNPEHFVEELKQSTVVKLVARSGSNSGGRFRHEVTWNGPVPQQVLAKLEARARMICTSRQKAAEAIEEPTTIEPEADAMDELLRRLISWTEEHPKHNKSLFCVARFVLGELIASGE